MPSESRLSGIDRRILNDVWSPHMYARRAAPRLGPHVEMTPWRRGAPASRVRRYADAAMRSIRAYALRPGERRAHEAGRRAGGGPSGRAVAGDCGDGAYPYEPRRPALLGAIFQVGPPARGARARTQDARRRGASERRSERCVRCVISTPDMRFPYRIWPISGPLAVGVPGRYGYRCRDHRAITDIVGHAPWPCPDGGRAPAAARGPRNGEGGARVKRVKAVSGYAL